MAYQMIHMEVAYLLMDKLQINQCKAEFILGSVAPDSVHFRDPYKIEDKIHTHLFENCGPWGDPQDYEKWMANMDGFRDTKSYSEKDCGRQMFIYGMYIHCLTDYYNDRLIWRRFQEQLKATMTDTEIKNAFYPEAQLVDKWLFQTGEHSGEICRLLKESVAYDLDDYVYATDLEKMKTHLLENQYHITEMIDVSGMKYYTSKVGMDFVNTTVENIYNKLKQDGWI